MGHCICHGQTLGLFRIMGHCICTMGHVLSRTTLKLLRTVNHCICLRQTIGLVRTMVSLDDIFGQLETKGHCTYWIHTWTI